MDWEEIFANHIYEKEFISRIYKENSKLNKKKIIITGQKFWTLYQRKHMDGK